MMPSDQAAHGLALWCHPDGTVVKVLHNDWGIPAADLLGQAFPLLVARSDFQKALTCLAELNAGRLIFEWDFDWPAAGPARLTQCVGLRFDDHLLLVAAERTWAMRRFFEAMLRLNNDQTNQLRALTKAQAELLRAQPNSEGQLYEALSSVNNELVSLQRELAQRNAELERLNIEIERLSILDELTHLYNRRGLFEVGRREVARAQRRHSPLTAIMIDLDGLKQLNDTYGHAVGDNALAEVADRLSRHLRQVDVLGRYGGDEFALVLPETPLAGARRVAEQLHQSAGQIPLATDHGPVTLTISLGVAALTDAMPNLEALLETADRALYQAKAAGGNDLSVLNETPA